MFCWIVFLTIGLRALFPYINPKFSFQGYRTPTIVYHTPWSSLQSKLRVFSFQENSPHFDLQISFSIRFP